MLPASVLYGGQEGLKPLSFKMCAFQGEKPLTNRLLKENLAKAEQDKTQTSAGPVLSASVAKHVTGNEQWKCSKCGAYNANTSPFCTECGAYK